MTEDQFRVLRILYEATAAVGDAFGSESTRSGLVFPTQLATLDEAARAFLPNGWIRSPIGFEPFATRYIQPLRNPAADAFATLIRHFPVEAAYLAPPGFDPNAHSRGAFFLGLFIDARGAAGMRVLIAFERVET
ncbi:MAG: hypothetical protein U0800_07460 [Isosphaeraceae bacterium]